MSTNTPAAPQTSRALLPLPRELRDQVYRYLLSVDYARNDVDSRLGGIGTAILHQSSYLFSPAILRVNKATSREAYEEMYKRNFFVTVTCQQPLLQLFSGLGVPYLQINEDQLSRFQHSRLHITIRPIDRRVHLLICGRDLEQFSFALRYMVSLYNHKRLEEPAVTDRRFPLNFELLFEARSTEFHTGSPSNHSFLLEHFRQCISNNLKVVIVGSTARVDYTQALIRHMTAGHPSPAATEWHILDSLKTCKVLIETACRRGDLVSALGTATELIAGFCNILVEEHPIASNNDMDHESDVPTAAKRVDIMFIDTLMTQMYLRLKLDLPVITHHYQQTIGESARRVRVDKSGILPSWPESGTPLHVEHGRGSFIMRLVSKDKDFRCTIQNFIKAFKVPRRVVPKYKPLKRDLAALQELSDQGEVYLSDHPGDLREFIAQIEFPDMVSSAHSAYDYVVPEQMQGWTDVSERNT